MVGNVNNSSEEVMPSEASMDIEENSSNGEKLILRTKNRIMGMPPMMRVTVISWMMTMMICGGTLRERIWKYRTLMCWVLRMEKGQAMS